MAELAGHMDMSTSSDVIERKMFTCFQSPPPPRPPTPTSSRSSTSAAATLNEWREGNIKSAFNYVLIDPRVTQNLPVRGKSMSPSEVFRTFVDAVFYVGKGSRARPYAHLYDACRYWKGEMGRGVEAAWALSSNNNNNNNDPAKIPKRVKS